MNTSNYWIEKLKLEKHPEGGFFTELYRSSESINKNALPARYSGSRNFATSIYFLLEGGDFSAFHRLQSDEIWHFYQGTALELFVLSTDGELQHYLLGRDFDAGERLQAVITKDHWFAARVRDKAGYALVGCTVSPGFHFDDFELANQSKLIRQFPSHEKLVRELTIR